MIARDLHNTLSYERGISPITQTNSDTAIVSQIIDMADKLALEFVIMTGGLTDANATFAVLVEDGDDSGLSDAAAVADEFLLPSDTGQEAAAGFTFADDNAIKKIGYRGIKRYVRLTVTPTGNDSGAAPVAVLAVGLPRLRANVNGS